MTTLNLGYGGIDPEVVKLLYSWTLKGGVKGLAVQTKCPIKGALSDFEYEGLQQRLVDAFDQNDITLDDFLLVLLFSATGRRPCQLGDLKSLDLIVAQASDGLREFVLNVPRRKQRGIVWREEFKPVALTPDIGLATQRLIRNNEARLLRLRTDLDATVRRELPLFPAWRNLEQLADKDSTSISALMKTDVFHVKTRVLHDRLEGTVGSLSVPSERTGAPIHVFPYRLRRTLGNCRY